MTTRLLTPGDVGARLGLDAQTILRMRREYGWPSVKLGRRVRFTEEHVAAIIASHTSKPEPDEKPVALVPGQTARSAARRRA